MCHRSDTLMSSITRMKERMKIFKIMLHRRFATLKTKRCETFFHLKRFIFTCCIPSFCGVCFVAIYSHLKFKYRYHIHCTLFICIFACVWVYTVLSSNRTSPHSIFSKLIKWNGMSHLNESSQLVNATHWSRHVNEIKLKSTRKGQRWRKISAKYTAHTNGISEYNEHWHCD